RPAHSNQKRIMISSGSTWRYVMAIGGGYRGLCTHPPTGRVKAAANLSSKTAATNEIANIILPAATKQPIAAATLAVDRTVRSTNRSIMRLVGGGGQLN